ncbi:MAG: hypothetical protein WCV63_01795 [Negativicutes bacterium]|jgi:hypothetical protein
MFGKIKAFFAYLIAVAAILFMVFSFVGMDKLEKIVLMTGLHPTAWYSGGQPATTVQRKGYELTVNHPVFKTVFGDAREGFVQFRLKGQPTLPAEIKENINIDGYVFGIIVDTIKLTAKLTATDRYAGNVQWVYLFDDKSVAVRVKLKNRH